MSAFIHIHQKNRLPNQSEDNTVAQNESTKLNIITSVWSHYEIHWNNETFMDW